MDNIIGQIEWSEVGGFVMAVVFVVFLFERAWGMFQKARGKGDGGDKEDEKRNPLTRCVPPDVDMRQMARQVNELHQMHEVFDSDGVRLWYVRRSFYEMMEKSSDALQKISAILPMLLDNQAKMGQRLEKIQRNTDRGGE